MSEKIWSSGKVGTLTFFSPQLWPTILEEVNVNMNGEEYTIPAVKHPNYDPLTCAVAMIVKLHQRVEVLEAELKGDKGEDSQR